MRKKRVSANSFNGFEKVRGQIKALHEEISALSKRRPDDSMNLFKLKIINQILASANDILKAEYLPQSDFRTFDEEKLPTNSDVVIILSQYLECFDRQSIDGSSPFDLKF